MAGPWLQYRGHLDNISNKWECLSVTNKEIKLINKGFLFVDEISTDMFV